MKVYTDYSLKHLNTFGIDTKALFYIPIESMDDMQVLSDNGQLLDRVLWILGGGSNTLFQRKFKGLVIHNQLKGIKVVKEDKKHVWIECQGGEEWHDLVMYCVENDWAGIENLSLIPGSVGAAPMQNIGAYGVEIKDVFESLKAFELRSGKTRTFNHRGCEFAYRESVFKHQLKGEYFIESIVLKLNKIPQYNLSYGAVKEKVEAAAEPLSIRLVSETICEIRQSKLPDPKELGNCGSFFKNAIIPKEQFEALQGQYPEIPSYPVDAEQVKVPTGWLIEQCGWKGKKVGRTGVYEKQALVLVNHGNASGKEVYDLSEKIKESVFDEFGIRIIREVNVV